MDASTSLLEICFAPQRQLSLLNSRQNVKDCPAAARIVLRAIKPKKKCGAAGGCIWNTDEEALAKLKTKDPTLSEKAQLGQEFAQTCLDPTVSLCPDNVVVGIVKDALTPLLEENKNFILDGFPRTIPQAESLDKFLANFKDKEGRLSPMPLTGAVEIRVPDKILQPRILGRWIHKPTGKSFWFDPKLGHTKANPPKPKSGETLTKRYDDTIDGLTGRLKDFHKETEPIVKHYSKIHKLVEGVTPEKTSSLSKSVEHQTFEDKEGVKYEILKPEEIWGIIKKHLG